jgi:hypothetical protein
VVYLMKRSDARRAAWSSSARRLAASSTMSASRSASRSRGEFLSGSTVQSARFDRFLMGCSLFIDACDNVLYHMLYYRANSLGIQGLLSTGSIKTFPQSCRTRTVCENPVATTAGAGRIFAVVIRCEFSARMPPCGPFRRSKKRDGIENDETDMSGCGSGCLITGFASTREKRTGSFAPGFCKAASFSTLSYPSPKVIRS